MKWHVLALESVCSSHRTGGLRTRNWGKQNTVTWSSLTVVFSNRELPDRISLENSDNHVSTNSGHTVIVVGGGVA